MNQKKAVKSEYQYLVNTSVQAFNDTHLKRSKMVRYVYAVKAETEDRYDVQNSTVTHS